MPRGTDRYDEALKQGRLWTPAELRANGKLYSWFDIADLSTVITASGKVSQWSDKSGFARHAANATGATQPNLVSQNRGLIFASGTNELLGVTAFPTTWEASVVGTPHSSTASYRTVFFQLPGYHTMTLPAGGNSFGLYDGADKVAGSLTWVGVGQAHVRVNSATSVDFGRDGSALVSPTGENGQFQITQVGGNQSATQTFGTLNEIVVTSLGLTDQERYRLEGYNAWKWTKLGIGDLLGNLSASHLFKNRPPLIGT